MPAAAADLRPAAFNELQPRARRGQAPGPRLPPLTPPRRPANGSARARRCVPPPAAHAAHRTTAQAFGRGGGWGGAPERQSGAANGSSATANAPPRPRGSAPSPPARPRTSRGLTPRLLLLLLLAGVFPLPAATSPAGPPGRLTSLPVAGRAAAPSRPPPRRAPGQVQHRLSLPCPEDRHQASAGPGAVPRHSRPGELSGQSPSSVLLLRPL